MSEATMKLIETVANDNQATFSARATAQVILHLLCKNISLQNDVKSLAARVAALESRAA